MKYRPEFPDRFGSIDDAIAFTRMFVRCYNTEHHHTALGLLTPEQVHYGLAEEVIKNRNDVLARAYEQHPERFAPKPRGRLNRPVRSGSTDRRRRLYSWYTKFQCQLSHLA